MKHTRRDKKREDMLSQYQTRQPFSKIWKFMRDYRFLLLNGFIALVIYNILGLALPWMLKISIDRILPNADYLLFWILSAGMLIIYLMRALMRYVARYLVDYTGIRIIVDVRQKLFKHLQSLSLRFYQEFRTGKLISSVMSDVNLLNGFFISIAQVCEQVFQLVVVAVLLLVINRTLGMIAIFTLPLHYINFRFFKEIIRRDAMVLQEKNSEISANLSETLSGVKVVKSFAKERTENLDFFHTMRPIIGMQMHITTENSGLWANFDVLTLLTYLAIIGVGVTYVQDGSLTIGEFVAFYTYFGMLIAPINALSSLAQVFAQGMVGASRILWLLGVIPEIREAPNPIHVNRLEGRIEFRDVSFYYDKEKLQEPVIDHFNLTISPGQKVALVGPSGSGKSTISNLLLRFYDVTGGAIRVDGHDVRKLSLDSYRNNIGVVLQEPFLFSGTIRDNIAYAMKRPVTEEEIIRAAEMANVAEFVDQLPEGYDSIIGENGASLSGGQKQRLAIARAVLKNPSILILDEATSALDTVSEYLVQDALDKLMADKTTIIIAHRLSTIRNADVIVVLDEGRIVQQGTHDELIAQEGTYKQLYLTQQKVNTMQ